MSFKVTEISEMVRLVLDCLEDRDLSACLLTCKLWSQQVLNLQSEYQRKLQERLLWGEYLNIKYPFMSEVFTPIYNARIMIVSPRQAYLDWRRYVMVHNKN